MSELKSCPFCGGPADLDYYHDAGLNGHGTEGRGRVLCLDCFASAEGGDGFTTADHKAVSKAEAVAAWNTRAPDPRDEVIARLEAERDEASRRRDAWKAKAEGFDAVRRALREKVGEPWPPSMSRLLWAGIAADQKARADAAELVIAGLVDALTDAAAILQAALVAGKIKGADQYRIGGVYLQNVSDTLDASDAALAAANAIAPGMEQTKAKP